MSWEGEKDVCSKADFLLLLLICFGGLSGDHRAESTPEAQVTFLVNTVATKWSAQGQTWISSEICSQFYIPQFHCPFLKWCRCLGKRWFSGVNLRKPLRRANIGKYSRCKSIGRKVRRLPMWYTLRGSSQDECVNEWRDQAVDGIGARLWVSLGLAAGRERAALLSATQ